ncbi:DUF6379 domain-containing protein [Actinoplanes sp. NPDC049265]|uniref:C-glycoside deglycosidase beta subunit domain-containing protein n=1 Tax=Actinoplanes sp. NPDC049265 TaxID=3363902 RepID=UPI00371B009A
MFDRYIIVNDSLRATQSGESVTGFAVDLRLPYYRGLWLSAVTVSVHVDGEEIAPETASLTVHGNTYPLDRLSEVSEDRWPFDEAATFSVTRPGGLEVGEHVIAARLHVRVAYHAAGFEGHNEKTLVLREAR